MRRIAEAWVLWAIATGCAGPGPAPRDADLVLHNGKVVTVDDRFSIHRAVAVRDGRILEVGGDDLVRRYRAARTIDLKGKMVLPGFNDTHLHMRGEARRHIDLRKTASIAELMKQVRERIRDLGEGEWITGYGWSEYRFAEKRVPLRADLDAAAPRSPVILTREGGHSSVCNSMALKIAGLTRDSPNPETGEFERDGNGELNGVIREAAGVVFRHVPPAAPEELLPSFIGNVRGLLSMGITSFIQAGVGPAAYATWEKVYRERGETLPRACVQIRWAGLEKMKEFGKKTGHGDERLRIGAIKVFVDGGFTGPAAYTLEPYKGEKTYRGKLRRPPEELRRIVREAHGLGWQLGFHAIGDGAIVLAVDAFVEALEAAPRKDHRHFLNHFTVTPPARSMKLMAEHGIMIAQQPNFVWSMEGRYVECLDGDRLRSNNSLRTPMKHGVFVALGSDILPTGPMLGLYCSVTRKGESGAVYGPEERLTMEEAIRGYTRNGAVLTFEEDVKGTIEPGKLADLIVLSDDLLTIAPERILDVKVLQTFVGGRLVYERK